ncbi:unnamed protein product [Periconia digitata]|uniref:Uncharacterized protein n=1 Tax=Periconia digitata TaxID=1303443 RepID=A0A9W4UJU5_9PLEO|nr:unnamed protein product [Periconia digitata]
MLSRVRSITQSYPQKATSSNHWCTNVQVVLVYCCSFNSTFEALNYTSNPDLFFLGLPSSSRLPGRQCIERIQYVEVYQSRIHGVGR